jgi:hypothetical protein
MSIFMELKKGRSYNKLFVLEVMNLRNVASCVLTLSSFESRYIFKKEDVLLASERSKV